MLPDILKIAEEYHLEIDERTRNQKEVLCKCVFCHSSSGKYHLSLNPEKKIFKCWKCKQSGGVLQFEALLSGKPFNEVREKRSEEHTSELQSRGHLVCRLLLEKKNQKHGKIVDDQDFEQQHRIRQDEND